MATIGYDETVLETEWSEAFLLAGASGVVATPSAWKVSRVSGFRRVQIAAGAGFAIGIQEARGTASVLDLPQPRDANGGASTTVGQWFLVGMNYERATSTATIEAVPGPTTSTTTPTLAPTTWPTLQRTVNDYFQPLAWCWVHPTDVAKYVDFDLRRLPSGLPAGLTGGGIWRYARTGNAQDAATTGLALDHLVGTTSATKDAPPGVYRLEACAVMSAQNGAATNVLTLTVNGQALRSSRRDLDLGVQTLPIGDYFVHPGGDLTWSMSFTTTVNPGVIYRNGTVATLTWERNVT